MMPIHPINIHTHPSNPILLFLLLSLLSLSFLFLLQHQLLRGSSSTSTTPDEVPPAKIKQNELNVASGQHLLLDLKGGNFQHLNNEESLRQATINIVKETKMTLLGIQSYKLHPQGVSVVATLAESHLSIHTWPEHGSALIDLFTCGSTNLQAYLQYVVDQYQGDLELSTYSLVPRGDAVKVAGAEVDKQFYPIDIMQTHKYKKKIFETQSKYQNIAIYDHHDVVEDDFSETTTRSLFLDGVVQSNVNDEKKYHESLVHPAFIASSVDPKRVLIVGGGEGGTLREVLKWKSVEDVVMVELDAEMIRASREFLPTYNDCTGFGTPSCFDDPRLRLYTEDFIAWFDAHIGNDICHQRGVGGNEENSATSPALHKKLFDVIILDLLDSESLPEGEVWAEHLYSPLFFERLACATTDLGVIVSNFGEAPEAPFLGGKGKIENVQQLDMYNKFTRKIEQIQTMSRFFRHTRVFDTPIPSYRANWSIVVGIVPLLQSKLPQSFVQGIFDGISNAGINDFDGTSARVNLKIRRGLKEGAKLQYYDGVVQHGFQHPTADWQGVYCLNAKNSEACKLPSMFTVDYEEDMYELRLRDDGGLSSTVVAKRDIPKGTVSGMYEAAVRYEATKADNEELSRHLMA
jgi:S-adenosylmethionine decarboxylase proenzyme